MTTITTTNTITTTTTTAAEARTDAAPPRLLTAGGLLLLLYVLLRPWSAETGAAGAAAFADPRWPVTHVFAIAGFTCIAAAGYRLAHWSGRRSAPWLRTLAWVTPALLLPYYGAEAFAVQAVGRRAVETGDLRLLELVSPIRMAAIQASLFALGWVALAATGVLLAMALVRYAASAPATGTRLRGFGWALAGALAAYLPVFFVPPAGRIAHAVLVAGCSIGVAAGLRR